MKMDYLFGYVLRNAKLDECKYVSEHGTDAIIGISCAFGILVLWSMSNRSKKWKIKVD